MCPRFIFLSTFEQGFLVVSHGHGNLWGQELVCFCYLLLFFRCPAGPTSARSPSPLLIPLRGNNHLAS